MNTEPSPKGQHRNLEIDPERARRMAIAEVPEREAILRAKVKPYQDRTQLSKKILRHEAWAEDAAERAGVNYDHDMSSGEFLVDDIDQAERMAYAMRPGMERYKRGQKLRRAVDIIIDNVITNGGFEGMPRMTAYLHDVTRRYFKRKEKGHLAQADSDAEATRRDVNIAK